MLPNWIIIEIKLGVGGAIGSPFAIGSTSRGWRQLWRVQDHHAQQKIPQLPGH